MRSATVDWDQPSRQDPARAFRRGRAVLAASVLGASTTVLLGCGSSQGDVGLTHVSGAAATRTSSAANPDTVLNGLAAQLHADVDHLSQGLAIRTVTRFLDERQECQVGADEWPAQWILDERIYLVASDARPSARTIASEHASAGWAVQANPPVDGADGYTLRRGGFVVSITAGGNDGSLNLQTNGPCVNADGTTDEAPSR